MLPQYFSGSAFKELPYWRVWAGEISSRELQDKIVLVGFADEHSAESNTIPTPITTTLPSVTAVASATSSILNDTWYSRPLMAAVLEWSAMAAVILIA